MNVLQHHDDGGKRRDAVKQKKSIYIEFILG